MRIGFDLDKVFIDYPPFIPDLLIDKLYKKKSNGTLLYRIPTKPEQILRNLSHLPVLRPPLNENIAFLQSISKKNNKLYLISSRYGFLRKRTEALMKKYGFDKIFDKLYFNFENKQPHLFKNEVIKKLHLDLYVDDDLHLINFVARHNPETKFFWLYHSPKEHKMGKNVFRISKLPEILCS